MFTLTDSPTRVPGYCSLFFVLIFHSNESQQKIDECDGTRTTVFQYKILLILLHFIFRRKGGKVWYEVRLYESKSSYWESLWYYLNCIFGIENRQEYCNRHRLWRL